MNWKRFALTMVFVAAGCDNNTALTKCTSDTSCDDNVYCNGAETCDATSGKCLPGTAPPCDDSIACTVDQCNEIAKKCDHLPDDNLCTAGQTCSPTAGCTSVCTGSGDDMIACTIDVCDAVSQTWQHLPSDAKCPGTQKCDAMLGCVDTCQSAGCNTACTGAGFVSGACSSGGACICTPVSQGTLAGKAYYFGKTDNTGIAVAVMGTSLTATTAADGSYTITDVPTGLYTVTFNATKYIAQLLPNITVAAGTTTATPDVTLYHGKDWGPSRTLTSVYQTLYSPAHSQMAIVGNYATGGYEVWANPTDASSPAVELASSASASPQLTETNAVWVASGVVFTRPTNASAPAIALSPLMGSSPTLWYAGKYAVFSKYMNGVYTVWAALSDGSSIPTAPIWQAPSSNFYPSFVFANDTTVAFTYYDSGTCPSARIQIYSLSGGAVLHDLALAGLQYTYYPYVSPDQLWVLGMGYNCGTGTYRAFLVNVSAGTAHTSAVDTYLSTSNRYLVSDGTGFKGFVWEDDWNTPPTLRGWLVSAATVDPITLIAGADMYRDGSGNWAYAVYGRVVAYTDAVLTGGKHPMKVIQLTSSPPPAAVTIDASGYNWVGGRLSADLASVLLFWQSPANPGAGTTSLNTASVVIGSAPVVTGFNATISATCSLAGLVSGDSLFYNCRDNTTLSAFVPPHSTSSMPVPIDSSAAPMMGAIAAPINRVVFLHTDGSAWTVNNDGTGKVMVSNQGDFTPGFTTLGNWVVFRDLGSQFIRASLLDGTAIDEPLVPGDAFWGTMAAPVLAPGNATLWAPVDRGQGVFRQYMIPAANLP